MPPCIICEDLELYGGMDVAAREAVAGGLRCEEHARWCRRCLGKDVADDRCDDCEECGKVQPVCLVCRVLVSHYDNLDVAHYVGMSGSRRCFLHADWCAACLKHSVESDDKDVCAKCEREGRGYRVDPGLADYGRLMREKMLCFHGKQTSCHTGHWERNCGCSCYWCSNMYGWVGYRRSLPPPPTEQEEADTALREHAVEMLWALFHPQRNSSESVWRSDDSRISLVVPLTWEPAACLLACQPSAAATSAVAAIAYPDPQAGGGT
jgi:hypothetical protein